ncbi:MAG: DUF3822 family protein [Prevotella sp.]|nr:DUF3822 family protein [Prevotella sp.]
MENSLHDWLTIRVGRGTLAFALPAKEGNVTFEPYIVKSGVSMAANLREAFKTSQLLTLGATRARVMLESNVLTVPIEKFEETQMADLFHYTYPGTEQDTVCYNVLPDLNAVAVFAVNKDLKLVIDDHFKGVKLLAAITPVWRHLHQRSYIGPRNKLYGYFHERQLDVFSFQQNRFRFCNAFEVRHAQDALYFLLFVWRQLQLQSATDELHLVGELPDQEWLTGELRRFLRNVLVVSPQADFNHAPVTAIKGMPYDMQTLFVKGR